MQLFTRFRSASAAIVLLTMLCLAGCNSKKMALERLRTANWTELDAGIDYISTRNGTVTSDSARYLVMGFITRTGAAQSVREEESRAPTMFSDAINREMKNKLPGSQQGYLRLNLLEVLRKDLVIMIFLKDYYDTASLQQDLELIRQVPGVKDAVYLSRDSALEQYIADGNEDWRKILDENPLPASIHVRLDEGEITIEQYKEKEARFRESIQGISDISYPQIMFNKWDGRYLVLQYERD